MKEILIIRIFNSNYFEDNSYLSIKIPPMIGPGIVPISLNIKILMPIECDRSSGGTILKIEFVAGTPLTKVKKSVKK